MEFNDDAIIAIFQNFFPIIDFSLFVFNFLLLVFEVNLPKIESPSITFLAGENNILALNAMIQ